MYFSPLGAGGHPDLVRPRVRVGHPAHDGLRHAGIGPVTAQKIVAYRQQHGAFHSVAELDAIPGIGPARIDQLKGLVAP